MILLSTQLEAGKTITPVKYVPEVTMVLPFQPLLYTKSKLEQQLKMALAKVENQLMSTYTIQQAMPVFVKIQKLISSLNFYTHKKSVAIFTSPIMEKVLYLDFEVEERIVIDGAFKLTDIATAKKEQKQFLLLQLTKDASQLYVGNPAGLHLIMLNKHLRKSDAANDAGISSVNDIKSFSNFLFQVDKGLAIVLKSHPYPVFIVGDDKIIEWYKSITQNDEHISRRFQQQHLFPDTTMLLELIKPYFPNWRQIIHQKLMRQLHKAHQEKHLVYGFTNVQKSIKEKGCLLLIEEGHNYPATNAENSDFLTGNRTISRPFYLHDTVDEVAEKVLECGGGIELLPEGSLARYQHIACLRPA